MEEHPANSNACPETAIKHFGFIEAWILYVAKSIWLGTRRDEVFL